MEGKVTEAAMVPRGSAVCRASSIEERECGEDCEC